MSSLSLRPATPTDAPALQAIYAPIVEHTAISFELAPPTVDEMAERIRHTTRELPWLVAEDAEGEAGTVAGYAYASRHRTRAAYRWSVDVSLYIHEQWRGQGVGSALYGSLFDELRPLGYISAYAGIALPNDASIALHEKLGFVPISRFPTVGFKLGTWHDVGWWHRLLQAPTVPPVEPTPWRS